MRRAIAINSITVIYIIVIILLTWTSFINKKRVGHSKNKERIREYSNKKIWSKRVAIVLVTAVIISMIINAIFYFRIPQSITILSGWTETQIIESDPGDPEFEKKVSERTGFSYDAVKENSGNPNSAAKGNGYFNGTIIPYTHETEDDEEAEEFPPEIIENISEQYAVLYIFGSYTFEDNLTMTDIDNISELIDIYKENAKYLEMEKDIPLAEAKDLQERIDAFDFTKQNNEEKLKIDDYVSNSFDRFKSYKINGNIGMLEQAAISVESAVELRHIENISDYSKLFSDTRNTTILFIHVLQEGQEPYYSGTEADINYRIGKVLYKPAVNLKKANSEERKYSLCCSYYFLNNAYDYSTPDSMYAIEIAYYYLCVCDKLAGYMGNEEEVSLMYKKVRGAYECFLERGTKNPENQTYIKYNESATEIYSKAEKWLANNKIAMPVDTIIENTK